MDFSVESLKTCLTDEETIRKYFRHYSETSNGLTVVSFGRLLEALLVDSEKKSYELPVQWKTDWFRQFDLNGDDIIDWQEFQSMWTNWVATIIRPKSALLVIDVQNDFISGSLAVSGSEQIVPVINGLIDSVAFDRVVYTQDWHPPDHISFFDNRHKRKFESCVDASDIKLFDSVLFECCSPVEQKLWPIHCVQNTWGSQLHNQLLVANDSIHVRKGTDPDVDSYSAFRNNTNNGQTELNDKLNSLHITNVFVCGLATEFCVGYSALDAIDHSYGTVLIEDASRGISPQAINDIKSRLADNKGVVVDSSQVLDIVNGADRRPQLAFAAALRLTNNNKKNVIAK